MILGEEYKEKEKKVEEEVEADTVPEVKAKMEEDLKQEYTL